MPYAPWVLETLAAYNTADLVFDPAPLDWADLVEEATALTWDNLDKLLAAAHSAHVAWADPLAVWPTHDDASEALITYDLPDGTRRATVCQNIRAHLAPGEHPTWGDAVMWGLGNIRDTGERLARSTEMAMQRLAQQAADSVNAWEEERTGVLADMGLDPDDRATNSTPTATARPSCTSPSSSAPGCAARTRSPDASR